MSKKQQNNESDSIRYASLTFGFIALFSFITFVILGQVQIRLFGGLMSIGFMAAAFSLVAVFTTVLYIYQARYQAIYHTNGKNKVLAKWRDTMALSIAFSLVGGTLVLLVSYALAQGFRGLSFDIYTSTVLIGLAVAATVYTSSNTVNDLRPSSIIKVLAFVLIGGVMFAMVTNNNTEWWHANFSTLGGVYSSRATTFNLTLILAAFVMITLTTFIFALFDEAIKSGSVEERLLKANLLKSLFIAAALALGGVGLFPYIADTPYALLHNLSAFGLVLIFLILIGLLKWLAPGFSKEFVGLSYVVAISLVGFFVLFTTVGYFSLTAFQLSSFVVCFSWLILFLKQVDLLTGSKTS